MDDMTGDGWDGREKLGRSVPLKFTPTPPSPSRGRAPSRALPSVPNSVDLRRRRGKGIYTSLSADQGEGAEP
jgi:hypothetical protein